MGAQFNVLADAGNGVITQEFLEQHISKWGIEKNLPAWIPELSKPLAELSIDQLWSAVASTYPRACWGQYAAAYDGGGGSQTFFYQVMLFPDDVSQWFNWWEASCAWHDRMRSLATTTAAMNPNYRYYIGAGSQHTIWGSNKVYTDTTGGVVPLVDWVNSMLADDEGWTDQECAVCDLLPGDARPSPLQPPFEANGVVNCP